MKKISLIVLITVLLTLACLSFAGCGYEKEAGVYYLYNGETKDASKFIEIKKRSNGAFVTSDSETRGRVTINGSSIRFYIVMLGEEVILMSGTYDGDGVMRLKRPGSEQEMVFKRDVPAETPAPAGTA